MRRCIDILASLAALLALTPLLVLIALAVALESPGGPLYLAPRLGRAGRPFRMWKFRTMHPGAGPAITGHNDPRVTRLGRLLRRTKLDELPQFVNVLIGDMTLVGPRPESPGLAAQYTPRQRLILDFTPGITGPVQLASCGEADLIPAGPAAEEFYAHSLMNSKIEADLAYLASRTPVRDARIVLSTASLVLCRLLRIHRN